MVFESISCELFHVLKMKPPRVDARGILHFFGGIRRSTRPAHSSMGLRPWSSAKADKLATIKRQREHEGLVNTDLEILAVHSWDDQQPKRRLPHLQSLYHLQF